MLTLTDNARTAVRSLTDRAGLPEDSAGLRIAQQDSGGLELALVPGPFPGDETVAQDGARVYVDAVTSSTLADQELDCETEGGGTQFTLTPQLH